MNLLARLNSKLPHSIHHSWSLRVSVSYTFFFWYPWVVWLRTTPGFEQFQIFFWSANHMHLQLSSFAWFWWQLCSSEMRTRNKVCVKLYAIHSNWNQNSRILLLPYASRNKEDSMEAVTLLPIKIFWSSYPDPCLCDCRKGHESFILSFCSRPRGHPP